MTPIMNVLWENIKSISDISQAFLVCRRDYGHSVEMRKIQNQVYLGIQAAYVWSTPRSAKHKCIAKQRMHSEKPVSISLCKGNGKIQHLIWQRSENVYMQPFQGECLLMGEWQIRGVNEWEKTSSLEKGLCTAHCRVFNPVSQGGRAQMGEGLSYQMPKADTEQEGHSQGLLLPWACFSVLPTCKIPI